MPNAGVHAASLADVPCAVYNALRPSRCPPRPLHVWQTRPFYLLVVLYTGANGRESRTLPSCRGSWANCSGCARAVTGRLQTKDFTSGPATGAKSLSGWGGWVSRHRLAVEGWVGVGRGEKQRLAICVQIGDLCRDRRFKYRLAIALQRLRFTEGYARGLGRGERFGVCFRCAAE